MAVGPRLRGGARPFHRGAAPGGLCPSLELPARSGGPSGGGRVWTTAHCGPRRARGRSRTGRQAPRGRARGLQRGSGRGGELSLEPPRARAPRARVAAAGVVGARASAGEGPGEGRGAREGALLCVCGAEASGGARRGARGPPRERLGAGGARQGRPAPPPLPAAPAAWSEWRLGTAEAHAPQSDTPLRASEAKRRLIPPLQHPP